jgi:hypothetical protein
LPFFGFGHELSFFVFSFFFLSFSEFHFALCVVNALIKGRLRTRSVPVVDGCRSSVMSD